MKTSARTIRFFVEGVPVPKARPRVVRRPNGSAYAYTPARTREWEELIAWVARQKIEKPFEGPVRMELTFFLPRPKSSKSTFPVHRFDADNLGKSAIDALNGVAIVDDGQIVELVIRKRYGDPPGVKIKIEAL